MYLLKISDFFAVIVFDKVTKKYGSTPVLDKVQLEVEHGEFVFVVGESGAGKSTLIHLLIGAERISGGNITVDGFRVNEMKDKAMQYYRRRIGVVFQDYKLLRQKRVIENVAFALEVCGFERDEIEKRSREVLEVVGLSHRLRHFPHQLSGGERQRVAIARAMVHNPRLIIADEPTGNLDPKTAREILELLLKINEAGTTVLLTTHNKELVDVAQRRVVTLKDGKVSSDRKKGGYHAVS